MSSHTYTGTVKSYEALSLDLIRNALQSLTEAGLIMQHTSEVEGRDRLVKVDDLKGLLQLTRELGMPHPPQCVVDLLMSIVSPHSWFVHTHYTHSHTHFMQQIFWLVQQVQQEQSFSRHAWI